MSEIKYKLLKELPFCKVGSIGVIEENEIRFYYNNNKNYEFYYAKKVFSLIEQGWIEEYKPKTLEEIINEIYDICNINTKQIFRQIVLSKYEIKEKE